MEVTDIGDIRQTGNTIGVTDTDKSFSVTLFPPKVSNVLAMNGHPFHDIIV